MKPEIHPRYIETTVSCACGSAFKTRSTKPNIRLEICSNCHPFFTGRQKFVDTAGRVERFQKRFVKTAGETLKKAEAKPKIAKGQGGLMVKKKAMKILSSAPIKTKPKPGGGRTESKPAAKPSGAKTSTSSH